MATIKTLNECKNLGDVVKYISNIYDLAQPIPSAAFTLLTLGLSRAKKKPVAPVAPVPPVPPVPKK